MARVAPGDGRGSGPGGTGPTPGQQAETARRLRGDLGTAEEHAMVIDKGGELLAPAPLHFQGAGVESVAYNATERITVITIPGSIIFSTAIARPASPPNPCIHIATDTGAHSSWDGTTWRTI